MLHGTAPEGHISTRHELSRAILDCTVQWLLLTRAHNKIASKFTHRALPKSATLLKTFLRCAPPTPPKNLFFLYPGQKFFGLNFWGVWGGRTSVYQNFKNQQLFRGSHFLAIGEGFQRQCSNHNQFFESENFLKFS